MEPPTEPTLDRPVVPDGYGVPEHNDGLLNWSDVETRLLSTKNVWMATTRPDGRPHVVPRWGVWLDGRDMLSRGEVDYSAPVQEVSRGHAC